MSLTQKISDEVSKLDLLKKTEDESFYIKTKLNDNVKTLIKELEEEKTKCETLDMQHSLELNEKDQ